MIAIYLAAGKSSRMGGKKLVLPIFNKPLGSIALEKLLASSIKYILVIVNKEDNLNWINKWMMKQLQQGRGDIIVGMDAEKGLSHSLRCGIKKAIERKEETVIICLADQPFITEDMIHVLETQSKSAKDDYIASSHNGHIKPPIVFTAKTFQELLKISGDYGAKK
ncbi:MAG: NTP transferase domain-containing protein [Bacillus sp. (in: firmicutes)]